MKLNTRPEKKITGWETTGIVFCVFLITGVKAAYLPLLLLLLSVPKKKYGGTKHLTVCILLVLFAMLLAYLPTIINNYRLSRMPQAERTVQTGDLEDSQWQLILNDPGRLPNIVINTIGRHFFGYAAGFWGVLGWLDTRFPAPLPLIGCVIIVLMALLDTVSCDPEAVFHGWKRLLPLFGVLISFIGMVLVTYTGHTTIVEHAVGTNTVEGIQGRYFIPLFLPLLTVFANSLLFKKRPFQKDGCVQRAAGFAAALWAVCCGVFTVVIVLLRYWI